jgi:hypothetical protein
VVYDDLLPEAPTNAFLAIATSRTHSPSPLRAVSVPQTLSLWATPWRPASPCYYLEHQVE